MRYLIFNNTPAHVHLYRHAVAALRERGHEVLVLGRDDACAHDLLAYYDLPYELYGRRGPTKRSLAAALPSQFATIFRRARQFDPDVIFGRGAYAAFAGLVTDARTILVLDSVPWRLGYLLPSLVVDTVLTTDAFGEDLGAHHHRFDGFTECAYLHPDVFEHDPTVRDELGVGPDEPFAFVRFNGFGAFHDVGESGFAPAQARDLVRRLSEHATVVVSDEAGQLDLTDLPARPYDLHPARVHDALAAARLFVADSGTMVTEAALLGTPAVRATSHDATTDMGEFRALEDRGLVRNLPPAAVADVAVDLLTDASAPARWARRSEAFLRERADLTELLVAVAEYPERVGDLARATYGADGSDGSVVPDDAEADATAGRAGRATAPAPDRRVENGRGERR